MQMNVYKSQASIKQAATTRVLTQDKKKSTFVVFKAPFLLSLSQSGVLIRHRCCQTWARRKKTFNAYSVAPNCLPMCISTMPSWWKTILIAHRVKIELHHFPASISLFTKNRPAQQRAHTFYLMAVFCKHTHDGTNIKVISVSDLLNVAYGPPRPTDQ